MRRSTLESIIQEEIEKYLSEQGIDLDEFSLSTLLDEADDRPSRADFQKRQAAQKGVVEKYNKILKQFKQKYSDYDDAVQNLIDSENNRNILKKIISQPGVDPSLVKYARMALKDAMPKVDKSKSSKKPQKKSTPKPKSKDTSSKPAAADKTADKADSSPKDSKSKSSGGKASSGAAGGGKKSGGKGGRKPDSDAAERGPGVGKTKGGTYSSAGTVPQERGREMTDAQIARRKELGQKMLNAYRRGGDKNSAKLRSNLKSYAEDQLGRKPNTKELFSFIWAMASDWAIKGIDYPEGLYQQNTDKGGEE